MTAAKRQSATKSKTPENATSASNPNTPTTTTTAPSSSKTPDTPDASAPASPAFIVDSIFPSNEIHLFGGASHSGKTTLVIDQFILRWSRGLPVFGHESYPAPFCFVVCDRPLTTLSATLARTGMGGLATFPAFSLVDEASDDPTLNLFEQALSTARKRVPGLKVLFMDGIHRICPGRANDLKDVSEFLAYVSRRLQKEGITLIGIGHAAKVKGDEHFSNPRERFLGSSAWGTSSSTMIIVERESIDNIKDIKRSVTVMPLNAPDQILHYNLSPKGTFTTADVDEPDRFDEFTMVVSAIPQEREMSMIDFMDIAEALGGWSPVRRTVERYVVKLMDDGVIEKAKWGRYRLPVKQ